MITPAKEYWETWTGGIYTPEQIMIEFAKFHVKAALKAASKIDIGEDGYEEVIQLLVMNCYPLENIK